jgi:cytochrome c peroxidase
MIKDKYRALAGRLDEASLRLWAAVEARTLGRGGVSVVANAVGLSRTPIYAGLRELAVPPPNCHEGSRHTLDDERHYGRAVAQGRRS